MVVMGLLNAVKEKSWGLCFRQKPRPTSPNSVKYGIAVYLGSRSRLALIKGIGRILVAAGSHSPRSRVYSLCSVYRAYRVYRLRGL